MPIHQDTLHKSFRSTKLENKLALASCNLHNSMCLLLCLACKFKQLRRRDDMETAVLLAANKILCSLPSFQSQSCGLLKGLVIADAMGWGTGNGKNCQKAEILL